MSERPILFSGAMVRAILDGKKTQTRRVVNVPGVGFVGAGGEDGADWNDPGCWGFEDGHGTWHYLAHDTVRTPFQQAIPSPYGRAGDRLWVREKFTAAWTGPNEGSGVLYAADHAASELLPPDVRWRPSIHMPRQLSRLTLEVIEVRVERLRSISEGDAQREGIAPILSARINGTAFTTAYARLWDEINGKRATWASNPWVWVVSFKRLEP